MQQVGASWRKKKGLHISYSNLMQPFLRDSDEIEKEFGKYEVGLDSLVKDINL